MSVLIEWGIGIVVAIVGVYYARKAVVKRKTPETTIYKHSKPPTGKVNFKTIIRSIGGLPKYPEDKDKK